MENPWSILERKHVAITLPMAGAILELPSQLLTLFKMATTFLEKPSDSQSNQDLQGNTTQSVYSVSLASP
jgi:hypothetical protein